MIYFKKKLLLINIKLNSTNDLTRPPKMTSKIIESSWANLGLFLYHLDPDIRRLVRRIGRLHLKILEKKKSAVFSQTCYIYIYIYIRTPPESKVIYLVFTSQYFPLLRVLSILTFSLRYSTGVFSFD